MALDSLFNVFFVQALTVTGGTPISGVAVKIYDPTGQDITAQITGKVNPITNNQGVVSVYHESAILPGGVIYKIRLTKRGWQTLEFTTNDGLAGVFNFRGWGFYTKNLSKAVSAENQYAISLPPLFSSPIYPIGFSLETVSDTRDQRLITSVQQSSGKGSEIATDVDEAGNVFIDVHNRIHLKPIPVAVPDDADTIEDRNFSDYVEVGIKAETEDGFLVVPLNQEVGDVPTINIGVANMYPDGSINDLSSYVPNSFSLCKWITQLTNPICFYGYYLDVMIWLPIEGDYTIITAYYDSSGTYLEGAGLPINASRFVQRVKVNPTPITGTAYVTLQIQEAGTAVEISEILTVTYNYGN